MCGRIAQAHTPDELSELLGVSRGLDRLEDISPSYNIPPSARLPGLVTGDEGTEWSSFQWGILPAWKRDGRAMFNARSETVGEKPMFRRSFQHRRCVVPVTAYYEWLPTRGGKQPFCIRLKVDELLYLAGIHDHGACAILTRAALPAFAYIHDRMPVAMPRGLVDAYLEDRGAAIPVFDAAQSLPLQAYRVSKSVGNPRFNKPECLEPLP